MVMGVLRPEEPEHTQGRRSRTAENRPQYPGPGRGTFVDGSFFLERGAAGGFDAAVNAHSSDQT